MNKKFGAAAAAFALLVVFPACTDLTEVPQSAITPENFYRNEGEVISGLASVYAQLRSTDDEYYNTSEVSTDELIVPTRGQDWYDNGKWLDIHRQTFTPTSPAGLDNINSAWVNMFQGVARANVVLNGIANTSFTGKATVTAELRVLRAWYYFLLMDLFGGVPVVTDVSIEARPQAARDSVAVQHERPHHPGSGRRDTGQPVSQRAGIYRYGECNRAGAGRGALAGRGH